VASKTPNVAAIVGGTLGGLVTILILIILLWKCTARSRHGRFISPRNTCIR
jgi:hypothetical protein